MLINAGWCWWHTEYFIWLWVSHPVRNGNAIWISEEILRTWHEKSWRAWIMRNLSIAAETSEKKDVQCRSPPLHRSSPCSMCCWTHPGAPPRPLACLHTHQLNPAAVQPSGFQRIESKLCRIVVYVCLPRRWCRRPTLMPRGQISRRLPLLY